MLKDSIIAVIASLAATMALAETAPILPDTAAGRLGAELVRHLNYDTPSQLGAWADRVFSPSSPAEDRAEFRASLLAAQAEGGGVDLTAARAGRTPDSVVLTLRARRAQRFSRVALSADPTDPAKVRGADFSPSEDARLYASWPTVALGDVQLARVVKAGLDALARTTDFSGCVTVQVRGAVLVDACAGLAERNFGATIGPHTRFHIGSMDKMFTAVAIGQLVEAGKLSLESKLADILPDYPDHAAAQAITIWQLLHHMSGLGDFFSPEFFQEREKYVNPADYVDLIARRPKAGEPGKQWSYSNAGFVLLGRVVEKCSGESYFDYVQSHIFVPAGMTATGFDSLADVTPDLAVGYFRDDPFGLGPWKANWTTLPFKGSPAGGGYSTNGDLLRFARALNGGALLKPATLSRMFADPVPIMENASYASGFEDRVAFGQHIRGHSGGAPGMNAALAMLPDGSAVAVTSNGAASPVSAQKFADHIADLLAARLSRKASS